MISLNSQALYFSRETSSQKPSPLRRHLKRPSDDQQNKLYLIVYSKSQVNSCRQDLVFYNLFSPFENKSCVHTPLILCEFPEKRFYWLSRLAVIQFSPVSELSLWKTDILIRGARNYSLRLWQQIILDYSNIQLSRLLSMPICSF